MSGHAWESVDNLESLCKNEDIRLTSLFINQQKIIFLSNFKAIFWGIILTKPQEHPLTSHNTNDQIE